MKVFELLETARCAPDQAPHDAAYISEGEKDRKTNALWAQIADYEKRAKAAKNPIKKDHYTKMASELRRKLPVNEAAKPNMRGVEAQLAAHADRKIKYENQFGEMSAADRVSHEKTRERLLKKLSKERSKANVSESFPLGKTLSLPELVQHIGSMLTSKHRGVYWKMTKRGDTTFMFSAENSDNIWSMLVVHADGNGFVTVTHGIVNPESGPETISTQNLPMTLATASEIVDEAIDQYHNID